MAWFHRVVVVGAVAIGVWATDGSLAAAGQVREIPGNWESPGMRRISVVKRHGFFGLDARGRSSTRRPGRSTASAARNGWPASRPARHAPQWITLELFGTQAVSAVAVFGERIDNDGIQDAQVQVAGAKPGEFTTVATIADAKSASWLATFDPVKTIAVRLLITRSSGPSPHTDVYEIEVYGPPISARGTQGVCGGRTRPVCRAMERGGRTGGEAGLEDRSAVRRTSRSSRLRSSDAAAAACRAIRPMGLAQRSRPALPGGRDRAARSPERSADAPGSGTSGGRLARARQASSPRPGRRPGKPRRART